MCTVSQILRRLRILKRSQIKKSHQLSRLQIFYPIYIWGINLLIKIMTRCLDLVYHTKRFTNCLQEKANFSGLIQTIIRMVQESGLSVTIN